MHWIIETELHDSATRLQESVRKAGHPLTLVSDTSPLREHASLLEGSAIFFGSLNLCEEYAKAGWTPGVIGDDDTLKMSAWVGRTSHLVLNPSSYTTNVAGLEALTTTSGAWLGEYVFVRPDSALKPFAGRVLQRTRLSPFAVDFGFYFDDPHLLIHVCPTHPIEQEWRFVAVGGEIVASSGYVGDGRKGVVDPPPEAAVRVAEEAASLMPLPAVVIDVCKSNGKYYLVEYNLFSGSDLYLCDTDRIVASLESLYCEK